MHNIVNEKKKTIFLKIEIAFDGGCKSYACLLRYVYSIWTKVTGHLDVLLNTWKFFMRNYAETPCP